MSQSVSIKVLVVDDDIFLRESIVQYLEDSDFEVTEAENGLLGLEKFRSEKPDVVLLDLRMPEMDGLELLPILVRENKETPVIIVSGMGTMQDSIESLRLGAWDYITKPIHDMAFLEHAIGRALERARMIRELRNYQEHLEDLVTKRTEELQNERALLRSLIDSIPDLIFYKDNESVYLGCNKAFEAYADTKEQVLIGKTDLELFPAATGQSYRNYDQKMLVEGQQVLVEEKLEYPDGRTVYVETLKTPYFGPDQKLLGLIGISRDISERLEAEAQHQKSALELQEALVQTIQAISIAMEKRDPYTAGHQQRVTHLAVAIAQQMGLSAKQIEGVSLGSLIHDIGKIYVPAEILTRPGRISKEEFAIIKSHPMVGYDIVKDVKFPWPVAEMVRQHHERLDGSGYPDGLKGDQIALEAKIIAVADVVEAMASHRPYRPGLGQDAALSEIKNNQGKTYEKEVVSACVALFEEKGFVF